MCRFLCGHVFNFFGETLTSSSCAFKFSSHMSPAITSKYKVELVIMQFSFSSVSLGDSNSISFGYILRSGTAESHGSSTFKFLSNLHTFFLHSGCPDLRPHQQYTRVLFRHILNSSYYLHCLHNNHSNRYE